MQDNIYDIRLAGWREYDYPYEFSLGDPEHNKEIAIYDEDGIGVLFERDCLSDPQLALEEIYNSFSKNGQNDPVWGELVYYSKEAQLIIFNKAQIFIREVM